MVASASGVLGLPPALLPNLRILDAVGISPLLSPVGLLPPLGLAAPLVVTEIEVRQQRSCGGPVRNMDRAGCGPIPARTIAGDMMGAQERNPS